MDWIQMAEGRDRWRALVNRVVDSLVTQNAGNFLNC
jgi:hypothetical protein